MPLPADVTDLIAAARGGDRRSLARLITWVETAGDAGDAALAAVYPSSGRAWTVGLTGAPGGGKSTLTNELIALMRAGGDAVAVVAVDPSSPFTGGAILGDRVRMQDHIDDDQVYIRSLATRGHLGGISEATPRVVSFLDGMGFPEVLVETVGVGQSEVDVAAATDTTLVVVNPGWGDSIQAAKAGLLEVGDIFVVNKADRPDADRTVKDLQQMLELGGMQSWWPPIIRTVASTGEGVDEVWRAIRDHRAHLAETGALAELRRRRCAAEVRAAVTTELRRRVRETLAEHEWDRIVDDVMERRLDPWTAARGITARLDDPSAGTP